VLDYIPAYTIILVTVYENDGNVLIECKDKKYLGSFFLEPEFIKNVSVGAIWNFGEVAGLP
jgi:hypothetical protein